MCLCEGAEHQRTRQHKTSPSAWLCVYVYRGGLYRAKKSPSCFVRASFWSQRKSFWLCAAINRKLFKILLSTFFVLVASEFSSLHFLSVETSSVLYRNESRLRQPFDIAKKRSIILLRRSERWIFAPSRRNRAILTL